MHRLLLAHAARSGLLRPLWLPPASPVHDYPRRAPVNPDAPAISCTLRADPWAREGLRRSAQVRQQQPGRQRLTSVAFVSEFVGGKPGVVDVAEVAMNPGRADLVDNPVFGDDITQLVLGDRVGGTATAGLGEHQYEVRRARFGGPDDRALVALAQLDG